MALIEKKKLTLRLLSPLHHAPWPPGRVVLALDVCRFSSFLASPSLLCMVNDSPTLHFVKLNDQRKGGNPEYQKIRRISGRGWGLGLWREAYMTSNAGSTTHRLQQTQEKMKTQEKPATWNYRKTWICRDHPGLFRERHFGWLKGPLRSSSCLCWVNALWRVAFRFLRWFPRCLGKSIPDRDQKGEGRPASEESQPHC